MWGGLNPNNIEFLCMRQSIARGAPVPWLLWGPGILSPALDSMNVFFPFHTQFYLQKIFEKGNQSFIENCSTHSVFSLFELLFICSAFVCLLHLSMFFLSSLFEALSETVPVGPLNINLGLLA